MATQIGDYVLVNTMGAKSSLAARHEKPSNYHLAVALRPVAYLPLTTLEPLRNIPMEYTQNSRY